MTYALRGMIDVFDVRIQPATLVLVVIIEPCLFNVRYISIISIITLFAKKYLRLYKLYD